MDCRRDHQCSIINVGHNCVRVPPTINCTTTFPLQLIVLSITIDRTKLYLTNHQRSILHRRSSSQQSQPLEHRHREAPELYRLERRQLQTVHIIPPVLSTTGIIPNKVIESLKLHNLRPALHILKQKTVIIRTCRIVRNFLAEQCLRSDWSVTPVLF